MTLHDLLFKPENSKYKEELKWRNKGKLIMQQIVRAINYMHRWRIMHRDIKSENVMVIKVFHASSLDSPSRYDCFCY